MNKNMTWWSKIKVFGFVAFIGMVVGISLLIGGVVSGILILTIIGLALIFGSFFGGMLGATIVYLSYVIRLAKLKTETQDENIAVDPIEQPTELTYRQRGYKERGKYSADIFADSINGYKISPKNIKVGILLVLIVFFLGIALFVVGGVLATKKVQPLGFIIMFSGAGLGAGMLIVMGLVKSLPERIKVKQLRTNPKRIEVYEKEATVLQSIKHSSKEYSTKLGLNYIVIDVVYNVCLDCNGKFLSSRSFNYYKKGAKVKVYIEVTKPKNVYIALENLIIPIIVEMSVKG